MKTFNYQLILVNLGLVAVLLAISLQASALEADCTNAQAVRDAKSEFVQLRDLRNTSPNDVSDSRFSAAANHYVALAESCYLEKYGTDPRTSNSIDGGGVRFNELTGAAEFSTFGTKWGAGSPFAGGQDIPGPGLPGGEVTYSYMANGVDLSAEGSSANVAIDSMATFSPCFLTEVENSFDAWAVIANLSFTEVADDGLPFDTGSAGNIRLGSHVFDGPSGTLAHGYFPPPNGLTAAGDVHFDQDENWACVDTGAGSFDFGIVAIHEIGHAIGMNHQGLPPTAIMNPFYNAAVDVLQPDDILGAASTYGPILVKSCNVNMSQTSYTGADEIIISELSLSGASTAAAPVEWKVWIQIPSTDPSGWVNAGSDGSLVLPPGLFADFGPIPLGPASNWLPGSYLVGCRILNPTTGELFDEDLQSYDVVP